MKKKFYIIVWVLVLCLTHAAADELVISDVTIPQGGKAKLVIGYKFDTSTVKTGFAFSIGLPSGISFEKNENGKVVYEKDEKSIDELNIQKGGEGDFAGQPSYAEATIKGTEGTLLTLILIADESLSVGSTLTANVTNACFQTPGEGKTDEIPLEDFTFTITIGEPDDGRLKFNENDTALPAYTAGEKGDVTMKRTIKANEWSTICLPFTLLQQDVFKAFGSDVKLYQFSSFETTVDFEDGMKPTAIKLNFTPYVLKNELMSMAGGKPYLIKTSKDITEINADKVKLVGAVSPTNVADVEYPDALEGHFTGTFVKTTIPTNGLFISGNNFWYSTGNTTIKAFRAWFDLDVVLDQDIELSRVSMHFLDDDVTTGLNDINCRTMADDLYYDLQGRSIVKPTKKGLYIRNGKKEVFR